MKSTESQFFSFPFGSSNASKTMVVFLYCLPPVRCESDRQWKASFVAGLRPGDSILFEIERILRAKVVILHRITEQW